MATTKVVGFKIEIKGQKEIVTTTKILGLLNTQLILIGNTLSIIDKEFKNNSSSMGQMNTILKSSLTSFQKGNKVVKDLGNGYFEVTKQVSKVSKEIKENEKVVESDSDSIKGLIKRNKDLKKSLLDQTSATGEQSAATKKLGEEYSKNNDAIKAFRKELRTGKKATDASAGSLDELRAKSIALKKQYNALSGAQQRAFIGDGAKIRRSLAKTNKQIQKLDLRIKDGKTSIGLYRNAQRGLTKTLLKLSVGRSVADGVANGLRNIFNGLKEIATESDEAKEQFKSLNSAGAGLSNTFQNVGKKILGTFGGGITKIIDNVSFVVSKVGDAFISASEGTGIFAKTLQFIGSIFTDFPAIFGGIGAAANDFATTTVNVFKRMGLQLQIVFQNINKFNPFSDESTAQINKNIAEITARQKELANQSVGVANAYAEGYAATIKAQEEFKKGSEEEVLIEEKRLAAVKRREEAAKKTATEEKKRIADLKKARTDLLKQIEIESLARIKIAVDLGQKLRQLQIQSISDTAAQAIAAEKERFNLESKARRSNFELRKQEVADQEAEIIKLFGIHSQEFTDFIAKSESEILELSITNDAILELQAQQHQDNLFKIEKDGEATRLAAITAANKEELDEEAELNKELEDEEARAGAKSDAVIAGQIEKRKERTQATKDALVDLVGSVFSAISDISRIAFEAENARFDAAIQTRQDNISNLNEDLQSATGLQKKFLENQVEQEQKALDAETEAKEKARKEQGEAQKAIAITQAVIAAALGIANAFSLPPPASFIAAAATAVATGAQIAVIASQKFARGGILNGPSHTNGGISTGFGELEGGEAVITRAATMKHAALLSAINVDGGGKKFADGGVLGAPISAPSIGGATTDINTQFNQFMSATLASTVATNNRIDRLSVNLDLNNLEDVQSNDAELEAATTL